MTRAAVARPPASRSGSGLRLTGGALKGRRLSVAAGVRPTGARLREALFSIWGSRIEGCRFLDCFAGSGAVGLEAISRGAALAAWVESSARAFGVLRRNVETCAPERARLVRGRLPGALDRLAGERFDLIFADPPYAYEGTAGLLERAAPRLAPGGEAAFEHSVRVAVAAPPPWRLRETRAYGDSCLSFLVLDAAGGAPGAAP